jgi:hypothetical protein
MADPLILHENWPLALRGFFDPVSVRNRLIGWHAVVLGKGDHIPAGFTCYDEDQLRDQLSGWASGQRIPRVKIKFGNPGARTRRGTWPACSRRGRPSATTWNCSSMRTAATGRKQAIRVMDATVGLDVRWFEEPVSSDDRGSRRSASYGLEIFGHCLFLTVRRQ